MATVLGKLFPDDPSLGEPEWLLLKIYNGPELAPKVFECFGCDYEFRILKNRMLPFHCTL